MSEKTLRDFLDLYTPEIQDLVKHIRTLLPDPQKILTGTGKRARHIKLTLVDEIQNPAVQVLLLAAAELTCSK